MASLFPFVEKNFKPTINATIERELRFLGQSRIDALTADYDMALVKEKKGLQVYEHDEDELLTLKSVVIVPGQVSDVMEMLKMSTSQALRDTMGEIFGALFLDGSVLHSSKDGSFRRNECLSVNWIALQSAKPHLPHRDYVFLQYGDSFRRNSDAGRGQLTGALIWESIELDTCVPLPPSQNVARLKFRRSGFVVEELPNNDESCRVSFILSEAHPGRLTVSNVTKTWMLKMVSSVVEMESAIVGRALASQNLLTKKQFTKDSDICTLCNKSFSVFRRKHHCRVCGEVCCSKCSELKVVKKQGLSNEVRVCCQCRSSSMSSSLRSSSSKSSVDAPYKMSGSAYSTGSASQSYSYDDNSREHLHHASMGSSYSSDHARVKAHPPPMQGHSVSSASSSKMRQTPEAYHPLTKSSVSTSSSTSSDMILLNSSKHESFDDTYGDGQGEYDLAAVAEDRASQEHPHVFENTGFSYALNYSSRQDWPRAPLPLNEPARLHKVKELHLADPGKQFQDMCEYVAAEMGCSMASLTFVGEKCGFLMASIGVGKKEMSRDLLLEAHVIMDESPTIVLDASEEVRFVNNPAVKSGQIRFFAGFPLVTADGFIVGSLSVADPFARENLDGEKVTFLKKLSEAAIKAVEQNTNAQIQQSQALTVTGQGSNIVNTDTGMPPPPPSPDYSYVDAQQRMQQLLQTAYSTQCQVRMQVNPLI